MKKVAYNRRTGTRRRIMSRLDENRKKIDVIDRQIAELFEKRFELGCG